MIQYKTDLRVTSRLARKTLNSYRRGECPKKAEAALVILRDRQLFNQFVRVRMDRRKEKLRSRKEKSLTLWQRCVKFISRKA